MSAMDQCPTVSVAIIAHDEEDTVGACIESACQQDYPNNVEIIVIDGNSTDRTPQIVHEWQGRDCRVHLFTEDPNRTHRGPAAARRLGVELARGEYVLLMNADVSVSSDYVSRLLAFAQENDLVGTAGLRWNRNASLIEDFVNIRYWFSYLANPNEIKYPRFLSSDAALYRRADLLAVGNFDPALTSGEDSDIGWRLVAWGRRLRYVPDLLIYHKGKHYRTLVAYLRQRHWYGRGAAQLAAKYPFRYAAEQNKVREFVLRPLSRLALWLALTLMAAWVAWPLAVVVQLWPLWGVARLFRRDWRTYREMRQAAMPTRIRRLCCWLWPTFNWISFVLITFYYLKAVDSPDRLYQKWIEDPLYSQMVEAANYSIGAGKKRI